QLGRGAVDRQCARHIQLVGRRGDWVARGAVPVRPARRAAAVRRGQDTDRSRILGRTGPAVRGRPRPHRHGPRATAAPRHGIHRRCLDVHAGADRAAVNVYFHTFGCKANQYDTERVRQAFDASGATVVDDPAFADLAVINSCTVTNESEIKLRRLVRHVAKNSHAQTIVMGCAAALDDGAIAALPGVRAVVANADPANVLIAAGMSFPLAATRRGGQGVRTRGLLKIQDGCDEHCTFCATTIARGANQSRAIPELVEEARALAEYHAEIVLTGIHIGTYGQDRAADPGASARGQP